MPAAWQGCPCHYSTNFWQGEQMVERQMNFVAHLEPGYETSTHRYPSRIEMTSEGQKGGPNVWCLFEIRDGVPDAVAFRIEAQPDGRAVRTADMTSWQPIE